MDILSGLLECVAHERIRLNWSILNIKWKYRWHDPIKEDNLKSDELEDCQNFLRKNQFLNPERNTRVTRDEDKLIKFKMVGKLKYFQHRLCTIDAILEQLKERIITGNDVYFIDKITSLVKCEDRKLAKVSLKVKLYM